MQLREIRVVGFGALAHVRVRGLGPGLNVLHGPNEFGKTSLLEFCRRILFGFPPKSTKANQYPSLYSDKYGGELLCELSDGRVLTIARSAGKGGGTLTVSSPDGQTVSEKDFSIALGHVSADLYQSVFSVGLQELYEKETLDRGEVNDHIYGAGLGLGKLGLPDLRAHFEESAAAIYSKGAHKRRLNDLMNEFGTLNDSIRNQRERLSHYDGRQAEFARLSREADRLAALLPAMRAQLDSLGSQQRLLPVFSRLRQAERELAQMGAVPEIPDDAPVQLKDLLTANQSLSSQLEEQQAELRLKRAAHDRITDDPAVLALASDIKTLSQDIAIYRAALQDLPATERELREAQNLADRARAGLGEGWTPQRVLTFILTEEQKDALRQLAALFESRQESVSDARRKLELHRDTIRATRSRGGFSRNFRLWGFALSLLAGAGCALAALNGDVPVAIVSGLTALLILAGSLYFSASRSGISDPAEKELTAELQAREEALQTVSADWGAFLASVGLPPALSPEGAEAMLRQLGEVVEDLRRIESLEQRVVKMRGAASSVEARYARIAAALNEPSTGIDVASRIETLAGRLLQAGETRVRKEALREDIRQRCETIEALENRARQASSRLAAFLSTHAGTSPEQFREAYARSTKARELRRIRDDSLKAIENEVGAGDPCRDFVGKLASTTLDDVRVALADTKQRLQQTEQELTATAGMRGALGKELEALRSAEDLPLLETSAEAVKQQMQDAYRDWLTARIALWGISTAVSRYEEERQPDVIRAAQTAFERMTGGRYAKLVKPLDSTEIHVRGRDGSDRTVDQLSRGTREQLYLAMRLGLIAQYEQNAEPLPVIMDDILVNFDDERGPLAVKALAEFAKGRQVIVMTCHNAARRLYLDAGATELTVESNRA